MRKFCLVVLVLVFSGWSSAPPAVATVILYQTGFDTDTTNVPGTYAPFAFNPAGFGHPLVTGSTPTDATTFTQDGVLHIRPNQTSTYARPELTLSSQDLLGSSVFPSVFSVSFEMGAESGQAGLFGTIIKFDDRTNFDIHYAVVPGHGTSFQIGVDPNYLPTSASGNNVTAVFGTLYPVNITVTDLFTGSYQFDISLTDPATSILYTDTKVISYSNAITTMGFARAGPGAGDAIFDNLTISSPIPEPNTALLLGFGLVGLGVKRRRRTRGAVFH